MSAPWTPEQRRAAAADLCERAARSFRNRDEDDGQGAREAARAGAWLPERDDPEWRYRANLKWLRVEPADIDAAVAAILAGEHPPDSLSGRLAELAHCATVIREAAEASGSIYLRGHAEGSIETADCVLNWIGCPATPTPTKETP